MGKPSEKLTQFYELFERFIAGLLMVGMVVVICLAAWSFLRTTGVTAMNFNDTLDYPTFQTLFDRVLAAVIALELAQSVQQIVTGQRGLIQVRTVLIIGVLAVVRKVILLDIETTSGLFLVGIAATIVALGAAFAILSWIERGEMTSESRQSGA